jgi:hypothetical protein
VILSEPRHRDELLDKRLDARHIPLKFRSELRRPQLIDVKTKDSIGVLSSCAAFAA